MGSDGSMPPGLMKGRKETSRSVTSGAQPSPAVTPLELGWHGKLLKRLGRANARKRCNIVVATLQSVMGGRLNYTAR